MVKKLLLIILLVLALVMGARAWTPVQKDVWTPYGMSYDVVYNPWCKMWMENVWTNDMKVWSYRNGELIVSFPNRPYPTDWEAITTEATARAKKLGYGIKEFQKIEYTVVGTGVKIRLAKIKTKPLPPTNVRVK